MLENELHLPHSSHNILSSNNDASISTVNTLFTLKPVPKFKHVFVSRLDCSHSCDNILSYIRNSIDADSYIKFKSECNTYSSFKISVVSDIFDTINKRNFWPKNSFVKEFTEIRNTVKTRIPNRRL